MKQFPQKLRRLRESSGLTLGELAEQFSISKQFLWDLEQGRRRVHGELLLKIAVYFGVSTDYLLGLEEHPTGTEKAGGKMPEYRLDSETARILCRAGSLSDRGREQLCRLVEWVCEVDERARKMG